MVAAAAIVVAVVVAVAVAAVAALVVVVMTTTPQRCDCFSFEHKNLVLFKLSHQTSTTQNIMKF